MKKIPLVSCLMLTYNRYELFKRSFRAFSNQTYPNRELIIVDSGEKEYKEKINNYLKNHQDINVKHIEVEKSSIGVLRNHFFEHANGDFLIVWDDDDIHHHSRIYKQISICLKSNIDGTILRNFTAVYEGKDYKCSILSGLDGTVLFKNPIGKIKYPDKNQGEDTDLIKLLKGSGQFIAIIDEFYDLYKYTFHSGNTVNDNHFKQMIENNKGLK